jgi:hypothetical protein
MKPSEIALSLAGAITVAIFALNFPEFNVAIILLALTVVTAAKVFER